MKSYIGRSVTALLLVMVVWSAAMAQTEQKKAASGPAPAKDDVVGVWLLRGGTGGGGGANAEAKLSQWVGTDNPVLTPEGVKLMATHQPSRGPRSVAPSLQNDPQGGGNPPGLIRTFIYGVYGMEYVKLPDSMFQVIEWYHYWRRIWTDGRKLPDWQTQGPYWYGYSVGAAKGDQFEVQTEDLDNRAWLDDWGTPFSEALKLTEHWRRIDHDNMRLSITLDDPRIYTKPWTSKEINYAYQAKGTPHGELVEAIFAPIDEETFNQNVRDRGEPKK